MPDEGKNRQILVIGIIIIIVLAVVGYLVAGARGVAGILNFVKWAFIGVLIIGVGAWAAWFLFIRQVRDDRVALNVKQIIEQARLTKPQTLGDLFISGDLEHPQVRLGNIIGYTRVKNIKDEEEDVFVIKKYGMPFSMFEEPKVIRINPELHSEMVGDIICKAISLVSHGGFFYVNTDHLDVERIDRTIKSEVLRKYTMDVLRDIKYISDSAIGISPDFQKQLEQRSLLKIPTRQEPIQPTQPPQQGGTY
jgi:hypothetical protein